jgi:Flp pilus assembly protein TadD
VAPAFEPGAPGTFADLGIVRGTGPTAAATTGSEMSAEQWYELALDLEGSSPLEAIVAYQQVLERDPGLTDACVNLGRLYHLTGERGRAEAQYRDAVRLAPEDPIPHFNLGVLLEEQGRRDEAAHAYAQAVARDPEFADAHCNLGLLLESMGRKQDAMRHLMTARELYQAEE